MKLKSAMIAVTAMTSVRLSVARSIADQTESDDEKSRDSTEEEAKKEWHWKTQFVLYAKYDTFVALYGFGMGMVHGDNFSVKIDIFL